MTWFFLIFFFFSSAESKDCAGVPVVKNNKIELVTLFDGQSLSLFDEGKSLSNFKVKDQDGLNTCYSNSVTTVLKTILDGNPEVSYVHGALAYGMKNWQYDFSKDKRKNLYDDNGELLLDYGVSCQTIASLKNVGGACRVNSQLIENIINQDSSQGLDHLSHQINYYKGLAGIFDYMVDIDNKAGRERASADFKQILNLYNNHMISEKKKCEDNPSLYRQNISNQLLFSAFDNALKFALEPTDYDIDERKRCKRALKEAITPHLSRLDEGNGGYSFDIAKKTSDELMSKIDADPSIRQSLKEYEKQYFNNFEDRTPKAFHQSLNVDNDIKNKIYASLERITKHYVFTTVQDKNKANLDQSCANILQLDPANYLQIPSDGLTSNIHSYNLRLLMAEDKVCQKISVPFNAEQFYAIESNNNFACDESFLKNSFLVIDTLTEIFGDVSNKVSDDIFAGLPKTFEEYARVLTPGCELTENKISLENVSCAEFTPCDKGNSNEILNAVYSGEKNSCYDIWDYRFVARQNIITNLLKNEASGINVCTGFMKHLNLVDTNYCNDNVSESFFHAMTVSGYKCVAGKIHYEILNSYGSNYCPEPAKQQIHSLNKPEDVLMSCVLKDGKYTGRFYVEEDYLLKNTTGIVKIGNKK